MKVADVKLSWSRSASTDVVKRFIILTVDGVEQTSIELGPEVDSYQLEVKASQSVSFVTRVVDSEGLETQSSSYSFQLGDLTAPQPDTGLTHEVIAIRDVADAPTEPVDVAV